MNSAPVRPSVLPELCVFDLDACLWDKEMYEMTSVPTAESVVRGALNDEGEGVVGVMSASAAGPAKISLHAGSLYALQQHSRGMYPGMRLALASSANTRFAEQVPCAAHTYIGMRLALASSADTPFAEQVGRAALGLLEVRPGLTVLELLLRDFNGRDVNQIGRQPPLSPNKANSHFPRLREETAVRCKKRLAKSCGPLPTPLHALPAALS